MRSRLKNIVLSLGALGLSQALHADSQTNNSQTQQVMPSTISDQMVITPNAGPVVKNGADIFVDADFIYWTARQDGLPYAYTGVLNPFGSIQGSSALNGSDAFTMAKGRESYIDNKMDPGFKVGAGLDLRHDGWDNYLEYTWFQTHSSGTTTASTDTFQETLFPGLDVRDTLFNSTSPNSASGSVTGFFYDSAHASWALHFNVFDWELGRNFFVSPRLILRPHIGLKGTWQRQKFTAKYNGNHELSEPSTSAPFTRSELGYYKISLNQFYWGVGVRAGMDASWQFTPSWSIYGDWALSALWGKFDINRTDLQSQANGSTAATTFVNAQIVNSEREFHSLRAVLELALGLRWDYFFSDDNYRFRIQAGWEEQIWFSQNNVNLNNDLLFRESNNDLVLQGLTVKFRFDF